MRLFAPLLITCFLGLSYAATTGAQPVLPPGERAGDVTDICLDEEAAAANALSDLYCVNLVAVPSLAPAFGFARMLPVENPFGVAVTRDGNHRYQLELNIDGLPDPASLGPYSAYVAWVTTPVLDPMVKLGTVGNGRFLFGEARFNKFLILVTAEAAAEVTARAGKIVIRGASPSNRMEAHDLAQTAPLAVFTANQAGHEHGTAENNTGWSMPPMHPAVGSVPGMMQLKPRVEPFTVRSPDGEVVEARPREHVVLKAGESYDLRTEYVTRNLGGRRLHMLGFNRQYPGPLLEVPQDSRVNVNFINGLEIPSAIHWHGLRLDYRYDGVPGLTQELVRRGETFQYQLSFPDPGMFWFHPHHREDIQMDLGLYGSILVRSADPAYYSPVNREEAIMLDDVLLDEAGVVPFGQESANYMLMGRFGNTFLVNGVTDYSLAVRKNETVRFFVTNSSNTRTYNMSIQGHPMKLVGSDVGKFEREMWIESLVIAPAERYTVETRFDSSGAFAIENRVQAINHRLGVFFPEVDTLGLVRVGADEIDVDYREAFETRRVNADVRADIAAYRAYFDRPVDYELTARLETDSLPPVVQQLMRFDAVYFNPVEWSGTMPMMNWASTGKEIRWILEDRATGLQNHEIDWQFRQGDVVKIRLSNDRNAFHAMQHPIHIHGQRFLVLERDGVPNRNLVWKDTMILTAGSTADIVLELSNPGTWMVHCHIAEHIDAGMMFTFEVEP